MRSLAFALVLLPGCVFAPGNKASTYDVEKPSGDLRVPESKIVTVDLDATGLSEPIYETPPDRAFVIRDLRTTVAGDLVAEVAGAPIKVAVVQMLEKQSYYFVFRSPAGLKIPAGAKLRMKVKPEGELPSSFEVFVAGELVRL